MLLVVNCRRIKINCFGWFFSQDDWIQSPGLNKIIPRIFDILHLISHDYLPQPTSAGGFGNKELYTLMVVQKFGQTKLQFAVGRDYIQKHFSKYEIKKKNAFFGSLKCDLRYFFKWMQHLQFWFFFFLKFSAPSNMTLVHLFCFTTFFKFMFSKKFFFAKIAFLEFLFCKTKILTIAPLLSKSKGPNILKA